MKKPTFRASILWLLLCLCLSSVKHLDAQQHAASALRSQGEIPGFLYNTRHRYLLPETNDWLIPQGKQTPSRFISMVYTSGMVVYGDTVSAYCRKLIKKAAGIENQVYLVRCNESATFANRKGDLFVTSGLINGCDNEAQLLFWLLRAFHAHQEGIDQDIIPWAFIEQGLSRAVFMLESYASDDEIRLDQLAWKSLNNAGIYNESELKSIFIPELRNGYPTFDQQVDLDQFNALYFYVPEFAYQQFIPPKRKAHDIRMDKSRAAAREKLLIPELASRDRIEGIHYALDRAYFKHIRELCHLEYLNQLVLEGRFSLAIYTAYQFEINGYQGEYLNQLIAMSWYGFAMDRIRKIHVGSSYSFELSGDYEPAIFGRFLRSHDQIIAYAMGLRVLRDLSNAYPENNDFAVLQDNLLRTGMDEPFYNRYVFLAVDYKTAADERNIDLEKEENRKMQTNEMKLLGHFGNYILTDFVKDSTFIKTKPLPESVATLQADKPWWLASADLRSYKRSVELTDTAVVHQMKTQLRLQTPNMVERVDQQFTDADAYHLKYLLSYSIAQQYYHGGYLRNTPLLYRREIKSMLGKTGKGPAAVFAYYHNYSPALHDIDYAAIFVLPIPYLIPEFFYFGNRKTFAAFFFNPESGDIEGMSYRRLRDPHNPFLLQQLIRETVQTIYPEP